MKILSILALVVASIVSGNVFAEDAAPKQVVQYDSAKMEELVKTINEGKALIKGSDCLTCHRVDTKLTGPAYKEVAKRYFPKIGEGIIPVLAQKVQKGGNKNWGFAMMKAHPGLSDEDAQKMVVSILAMADPEYQKHKDASKAGADTEKK